MARRRLTTCVSSRPVFFFSLFLHLLLFTQSELFLLQGTAASFLSAFPRQQAETSADADRQVSSHHESPSFAIQSSPYASPTERNHSPSPSFLTSPSSSLSMIQMRRNPSSSSSSSSSSSRSSSPYFSAFSRSPSPSSSSYYSSSSRPPSPPPPFSASEILESLRASLSYAKAMMKNLQTFESELASFMTQYRHEKALYDQQVAMSQIDLRQQEEQLQWIGSSMETFRQEAGMKRKLLHESAEAVRNALHQLGEEIMALRRISPLRRSYSLAHAENLLRKGRAALERHNVISVEFCRLFPTDPSFCPPILF